MDDGVAQGRPARASMVASKGKLRRGTKKLDGKIGIFPVLGPMAGCSDNRRGRDGCLGWFGRWLIGVGQAKEMSLFLPTHRASTTIAETMATRIDLRHGRFEGVCAPTLQQCLKPS